MKLNEMFPSKWLKAADLEGRPKLVTVEGVRMEAMEEGKPLKPVLALRGLTQGLVLNKTNGQALAEFLGDDVDKWVGRKIVIFPAQAAFQGKLVDCIRVREPKPQPTVAAQPAPQQTKATEPVAATVDAEADDVPF